MKLKSRGQFAIFRCYRGFQLVGASKAMCHNNVWDFGRNEKPTCVKSGCSHLYSKNADLKWIVRDAAVKISCHPGHILANSSHKVKINTLHS